MSETVSTDLRELDALVVGAGFSGLYMLHRLRKPRAVGAGARGRRRRRRHLVLEPLPGRALRLGELLTTPTRFDEELQQEWEWTERYAGQPEILRYLRPRRRPLRPAPRHPLRHHASRRPSTTRTPARWRSTPTAASASRRGSSSPPSGCLSTPNMPDDPGPATASRASGTTPAGGRTRAWTSPASASRVIGTGSPAIQPIPRDRRGRPRTSPSSSAPPTTASPARNGPLTAEFERRGQGQLRRRSAARTRESASASRSTSRTGTALSVPEERARSDLRGALGTRRASRLGAAFADLLLDEATPTTRRPSSCATRSARWCTTRRSPSCSPRRTIPSPPSGRRSTPATSRPTTATTSRWSTSRDTPIEAITAAGVRTADGEYELDCIVFATGFDAMTGALLSIDIRGRGGLRSRRSGPTGPRTYLGLADRRLPEPVHDHRPAAAPRC